MKEVSFMKISVVMATYNGEKYVEKQLYSLLNQSVAIDEVIIADDKSIDNTPKIINSFIEINHLTNWKFYINDENLGFIKNFKNVISKATGDLIFLCDQDDIWHSDKIEVLKQLFIANPDALAINSSFDFIDENDKKFGINLKPNTSNQNIIKFNIPNDALYYVEFSDIIRYNISPGCTMAFRSELKDMLISNDKYIIPHDWEINLYAALNDGLYFFNKPLINYRIHGSNTIGLETEDDNSEFKIKGTYKKRMEVLSCLINLCSLLLSDKFRKKNDKKSKNYTKHLNSFCNLRMNVLKNHSIFSWLKLWYHLPFIKNGNSLKTVLGDLAYMLNIENHFKK